MADKSVLITGGAGYIGSHAVLAFRESGLDVVVIDDLSTGIRQNLSSEVPFVEGDAGDNALVEATLKQYQVDAVIHFAGSIIVPESVADPLKYYRNNTAVSRNLIESCVASGVRNFIFSSTAAVYGIPEVIPVAEDAPTVPINPYGTSKLMTEWVLRDTANAHDFRYAALRYFNVAGADPDGRTGQSTPEATHLIKVASQVVTGRRDHIDVFGSDYDTPDGTCVRDYIHVSDLAAAHVAAYLHLRGANQNLVLNCGYGHGYSVREVLDAMGREAGEEMDIRDAPRRAGDPPALVADASAVRATLGWKPRYDDLGFIVRTALAWERGISP